MEYLFYYDIGDAVIGFNEEMNPNFYSYEKLTNEQVAFWKEHQCSASEAKAMYIEPIDIQELKISKLGYVKQKASFTLGRTDYKVIRHYEQTLMGIMTTLSPTEFQTLMANRQATRDYSNYLEQQINEATSVEVVTQITWELV